MSWFDGMRERARLLLWRRQVERELAEELDFHLSEEAARAHAAGLSKVAAQRHARVVFGGGDRVREEVRDTWTGAAVRGLAQDIRHGARTLLKQPTFTVVALLTLALGLGANAAMFTLVRSVLLEPLPYGDPAQLVVFWNRSHQLVDATHFSQRSVCPQPPPRHDCWKASSTASPHWIR